MRRVVAIIGIILMFGCIIATIVCAIAGAPGNVLLALLFCDIVVPCILFGYSKLVKFSKRNKEQEQKNDC